MKHQVCLGVAKVKYIRIDNIEIQELSVRNTMRRARICDVVINVESWDGVVV